MSKRVVFGLLSIGVLIWGCSSEDAASSSSSSSSSSSGGTILDDDAGGKDAGPTGQDSGSPNDAGGDAQVTDDGGVPRMQLGTYMGSFSSETFKSTFGAYAGVESIYYQGDTATTPNVVKHEAQIDSGISPVITVTFKNGPFTLASIGAWESSVQTYFTTFVAGLKTIADYASAKNNGTRVYFTFEHEACVKINQKAYGFAGYGGGQPTIAESATAWNKVMEYVSTAAPKVTRVYWYGGSAAGEDTYAGILTPSLVQMATFDPYRWSYNTASDTASSLWGNKISHLKGQPWMKNPDGSLKRWGLTEWGTDSTFGDTANATFVTATLGYLASQGAAFAIYFDRVDGANDWVFTDGSQPKTLAAYKAVLLAGP